MLDPRRLRVTISLDGDPHVYEELAISVKGSKNTSDISNICEVRIANIKKSIRDKLLTEGTPYARLAPPKNSILVEAGRESNELHQVYLGDITTVNVTQAPDIWLVMRSITGKQLKNATVAFSQNASAKFSLIASQVAEQLEMSLDFTAPDKDVANFSFSGSTEQMVGALAAISNDVDAYIDDNILVVKPRFESNIPEVLEVNITTGLIGIPEFVGRDVRCTVLLTSEIRLGQRIRLSSLAYPAVDGEYIIYRLSFDLATRDTPFYYILEAVNPDVGRKAA